MTPILEIGEVRVSDNREGGRDYLLRPSFNAMMNLGEPEEIVKVYAAVHWAEQSALYSKLWAAGKTIEQLGLERYDRTTEHALEAAMLVLEACCDDDLTPLIGEWYGDDNGIRYIPGQMPVQDIIMIAQHLMQHGVTGKAKVRQLQRHESKTTARGFNAFEYISAARAHLDMNRREAAELTMTEFQTLIANKYPDQKGFTRKEYDDIADDFLARQAARRAAAQQVAA